MSNCFCAACAEMHERRTLSSDGKVTGGSSRIVDGGRWAFCSVLFVGRGIMPAIMNWRVLPTLVTLMTLFWNISRHSSFSKDDKEVIH